MTPLLEVDDLTVAYGNVEALRGARLQVRPGQIVSVIGPNGAGKSTMLNALMGLLPYRGAVRFQGSSLQWISTEARVRQGLCLVPEKRELFATMTVEDNLQLGSFAQRRGANKLMQKLDGVYATFPRLKERRTQLAGTLSGGERQMLALGRALMSEPKLLMLDEPSLGLAPRIVRDIFTIITGLRSTAILLVEQNARAALQIADYAYVLETGEQVLEGDSSALMADQRIAQTYLGSVAALPASQDEPSASLPNGKLPPEQAALTSNWNTQ